MKAKEKKNKKNIFLILRLLFVFFLIVGNTFAWFIFATRIDNTVDVHVKAWNVVFEAGDNIVDCSLQHKLQEITKEITI